MERLFDDDPPVAAVEEAGRGPVSYGSTYTVSELAGAITGVLEAALPGDLWVHGEVRNISRSAAGHVYFDLIDPVPTGRTPEASLSVVLFKSTRDVVNRLLMKRDAVRIDDGVRLRIRGAIDFYPPQGRLQIRMTGIDPAYTIGQLEADRERLLSALHAEGLLDANAGIPLPVLPLAIGLVTSVGSAAAADFLNELELSRVGWEVRLVDARVQGSEAASGIARAIGIAAARSEVVVVIRGGGARTDLVAFDNELVARAIAGCARPVLTGIGHEIDRSVADEVSHRAFKTPTACAGALVARVREFEGALATTWAAVATATTRTLDRHELVLRTAASRAVGSSRTGLRLGEARLDTAAARIAKQSPRIADRAQRTILAKAARLRARAGLGPHVARTRLTSHAARIRASAERAVRAEGRRLDTVEVRVETLDPRRALARGWSITRGADGRVIRSVSEVGEGQAMVTTVGDGTIHGRVTDVEGAT